MVLAALLDFICLGRGRLDLLAAVELSRDPGVPDGGEPDISPLAPEPAQRGAMMIFQGKTVPLAALPASSFTDQRDPGHTSCGSLHFPILLRGTE